MSRIIVLLLMIASGAMLMFVLKMPMGSLRSFFPNRESVESNTPAPKVTKALARNVSLERKRVPRMTIGDRSEQSPSLAASAFVMKPKLNAGAPNVPVRPANDQQPQKIIWSISADSAALYSTNSSGGPVLQMLRKGDIVVSDMEVLAAAGRWILIEVPNQGVSGFIRRDMVVRQNPEEPTGAKNGQKDNLNSLTMAEDLYRNAQFEEASRLLKQIEKQLSSTPSRVEDLKKLKLYQALVDVATNESENAEAKFLELLALEPGFSLESEEHSPKVIALFEAARKRYGRRD